MTQILAAEDLIQQDRHHLLECTQTGLPLILTFGFYNASEAPAFNFYGRLKKLEQQSGRVLNKLLLRDPARLWYLQGIPGLGHDVPQTVAALKEIIATVQPSCVITLGQSMGAYAALLYGVLLGVDKIISFGTLSCMQRQLWSAMHETRWNPVLTEVEKLGDVAVPYQDLVSLLRHHSQTLPEIDLIYGTSPGEGIDRQEVVGIDTVHALRFAEFPSVHLLPVHHATHIAVEYFRQHGVITQLLAQRLFGSSLADLAPPSADAASWLGWIAENLKQGVQQQTLHAVMLQNNLTPEYASSLIAQVYLRQTLQLFEKTPPRVIA